MFRDYPAIKILIELERDNLLPGILFRSSRKQCDADISKLARAKGLGFSIQQQINLRREIENIIKKYSFDPEVVYSHPQYQALITSGAGAHHAGQLLFWRLLLEELMSRGLLKLLIATGTVAAGVDFPARTAVVTAHSKRGSDGFRVLTASEFQQMSGRAGRRGKDSVGICLIAPSPFSDARVIAQVAKRPPEPLRSAYFASPSTVLNLLKYRNVDDLKYTVSKSLASFLDRKAANTLRESALQLAQELEAKTDFPESERKKLEKRVRREMRQADELELRQMQLLDKSLAGLTALGHVEDGKLTSKGLWSSNLCTTLVLELAEAIDAGLFNELSLFEFVGLVSSIAGDSHKQYLKIKKNPIKPELFKQMQGLLDKVGAAYERPASSSDVAVVPDAALTVVTWMEAADWSEFSSLIRLAGVADGDVSRLVSQTADHLNQIARLSESHPTLAAAAEEGRYRILRPPLSETLTVDMNVS